MLKKQGKTMTHKNRKEKQKRLQKIERDIPKIEKKIEKLEAENEELTKLLQEVSLENDHIRIRQHGEKITKIVDSINTLYKKLEEIMEEQEVLEGEIGG